VFDRALFMSRMLHIFSFCFKGYHVPSNTPRDTTRHMARKQGPKSKRLLMADAEALWLTLLIIADDRLQADRPKPHTVLKQLLNGNDGGRAPDSVLRRLRRRWKELGPPTLEQHPGSRVEMLNIKAVPTEDLGEHGRGVVEARDTRNAELSAIYERTVRYFMDKIS
jgi:hypothetical protein